MGNLQTFLDDLQSHITALCTAPAPATEPERTARTWLKTDTGAQPAEVNQWVHSVFGVPVAPDNTWQGVGFNGKNYHKEVQRQIEQLIAHPQPDKSWPCYQVAAWLWFLDFQLPCSGSPMDVIDWVKTALPASSVGQRVIVPPLNPAGQPVT